VKAKGKQKLREIVHREREKTGRRKEKKNKKNDKERGVTAIRSKKS